MRSGERLRRARQGGFTYVGLLALIVLIGLLLAQVGKVAHTTALREKETELLFIGHEYREAIGRFFRENHRYPLTLAEVIESQTAGPQPAHYLRRLYRDPMTGSMDWTLLPAPGEGIIGVASASSRIPIKHAGFDDIDIGFADARSYADWAFIADPRAALLWYQQRSSDQAGTPPAR